MTGPALRDGLGQYTGAAGGLTLHDLGELVRRAGQELGLVVKSEFPAGVGNRNRRRGDWIWQYKSTPIVAFEIEGRDVPPPSVCADELRFATLPPECVKVIALYSVADDHRAKRLPPFNIPPHLWVIQHRPAHPMTNVHVVSDDELMAPGGIESLQAIAQRRLQLQDEPAQQRHAALPLAKAFRR